MMPIGRAPHGGCFRDSIEAGADLFDVAAHQRDEAR
jgi:hypothetical protein